MARWEISRTRSRTLISSLILILAGPAAAGAESKPARLSFARDGKPVATRDLDWVRSLSPQTPQTIRVFEPYEEREVRFEAVRFEAALDAVYGPEWRSREELLFTCSDGYQPTVPVRRVLEHGAWLAFDRADEQGFSISKLESGKRQRIALGPFYLVWENLEDTRIRLEGDYGWPYQLVGVDLIDARDRFPKMVPPRDASARELAGFEAFRVHCSKCHPLNGEGGAIGPELNGAVSPLEARRTAWLRQWIDDPSQMNPTSRMPRLNPALPDRDETIDAILAYLSVMSESRHAD